jgi:hypothetical protein
MSLFKHGKHHDDADRKSEPPAEAGDYDVQADLALPTPDHHRAPGDVFTPYAGSVVPSETEPGYDVDRDIGS